MLTLSQCYLLLGVVILVSRCHAGWFVQKEDKCEFTANADYIIKFSEKPELFVNKIKTDGLHDCQRSCCEHDTCNGYVWDMTDGSENCKLLKCSNVGTDCKKALRPIVPPVGGNPDGQSLSVGFITGINDNSVADDIVTTVTPLAVNNADNADWLKQKLGLVPKESEKNAEKKNDEMLFSTTSVNEPTTTTPISSTTEATQTVRKTTPITTSNLPTTTKEKQSSTVDKESDDLIPKDSTTLSAVEKHYTHTNTVSLTVAFLFGIGFLVSAVFMLARRWFEGFRDANKKGYTRISYLLNGV